MYCVIALSGGKLPPSGSPVHRPRRNLRRRAANGASLPAGGASISPDCDPLSIGLEKPCFAAASAGYGTPKAALVLQSGNKKTPGETVPKRIFIATSGSRGDVEPFIALAKALQNAGYDVVLSAPPDYGGWIASHGIAHHAVGDPVAEKILEFADALEKDRFFQSVLDGDYKRKFIDRFASIAAASEGADLLIYSSLPASLTCICEVRGTPAIGAL